MDQLYDEVLGLTLAYTEKALYCGKERFINWDVGDSMVYGPVVDRQKLFFVEKDSTKAAGGVGRMTKPDGCFATLQGSHHRKNWELDALFWQTDFDTERCSGCKTDFGFSQCYWSIKDDLFRALEDFGCQKLPLYIVGHSLGAAMATYLMFDVLDKGYNLRNVFALESPRPGNDAFARELWGRCMKSRLYDETACNAWRVTHKRDIVVHGPDAFEYKHVLPEIYYSGHSSSEYAVCEFKLIDGIPQEDPRCSDRWRPWELTADDHLWYAAMNPTWCQNDTRMTVEAFPGYRKEVMAIAPECLDSFNVLFESTTYLKGAATCGQRITWLQNPSGGGYSLDVAMSEIARKFPGPCGACAAYRESLGLQMAYLEKALYCGADRFLRWDVGDTLIYGPKVDPKNLRLVNNNQTHSLAGVGRASVPDYCFVAIRGQDGQHSVTFDLGTSLFWESTFERLDCQGCKVESGYLTAYESIKDEIFNALTELDCKNQPLHLSGYSFGAGILHYLLYDLVDFGYPVKFVYAFESPRPGNKIFAKILWSKIRAAGVNAWRTSHYRDMAVHVPGSFMCHHVLPEIYYDKKATSYQKCVWQMEDGIPQEDKACSNQWSPWELHMKGYGLYAGTDPRFCSNKTAFSLTSAAAYRESLDTLSPDCIKTLNVLFHSDTEMVGSATCGERLRWLQTYAGGGYTQAEAMNEIARLFPGPCGPCATLQEVHYRLRSDQPVRIAAIVVGATLALCALGCFMILLRKLSRRKQIYADLPDEEDSGSGSAGAQE